MCGEVWREVWRGVWKKGVCIGVVLWALFAFSVRAEAAKFYVTQNGAGSKDGSSWGNALDEAGFRNRLVSAGDGDVFWVAKGVYRPATNTFDSYISFELKDGVELYGGFAGGERTLAERDVKANITVLTGDIKRDDRRNGDGVTLSVSDINGSNSHCVVRATDCSASTVLDGFTICGGKQEAQGYTGGMRISGGAPRVTNCTFVGNQGTRGGGMFIDASRKGASEARIIGCTFAGNRTRDAYLAPRGGALHLYKTSAVVAGCTFADNEVGDNNKAGYGGGVSVEEGSPTVANCTFVRNVAFGGNGGGGGLNINNSSVKVVHCTFTGNQGDSGSGIRFENAGSATVQNCILWGDSGSAEIDSAHSRILKYCVVKNGTGGTGTITQDPKLSPLANNGGPTQTIAIGQDSSARDKGNLEGLDADVKDLVSVDQRGNPRNGAPDIGAYELASPPPPPIRKFSVTVSCDAGGIVMYKGSPVASSDASFDVSVTSGDSVSFDIAANAGYVIGTLKDNGNAVAEAAGKDHFTYRIENVTASHDLAVTFRASGPGPNPPSPGPNPPSPGPNPPSPGPNPPSPGPNPPSPGPNPPSPGPNPPSPGPNPPSPGPNPPSPRPNPPASPDVQPKPSSNGGGGCSTSTGVPLLFALAAFLIRGRR